MDVVNYTLAPHLGYSGVDSRNREFGVFAVKSTWDLTEDSWAVFSEEQEPFVFTDEYFGDLNVSSVRYPSDFVPYKPQADILLSGKAFSPGGKPTRSFPVGVRISNERGEIILEKALRVTGPRNWVPKWKRELSEQEKANWRDHRTLFEGWDLQSPELITQLDLSYDFAFGGTIQKGRDGEGNSIYDAFELNPIGIGLIDPDWTDHTIPHPAPQIEALDNPVTVPYKNYDPQGFGPIAAAWLPRRPLGGTYDQNWIENIWPQWPADYDFAFHNSALQDQQIDSAKLRQSALHLHMVNLHPEREVWKVKIPKEVFKVSVFDDSGSNYRVNTDLDTLFLDLDPGDPRIFKINRCLYPMPYQQKAFIIHEIGEDCSARSLSGYQDTSAPGKITKRDL